MLTFHINRKLRFPYKNYRGETSTRTVRILGVDYGSNEWYAEDQWFLRCWDFEKQAHRSFAFARIDPRTIEIIE